MSIPYFQHPSSFRDPSGFVFEKDNVVYRQVNQVYKQHFDFFIGCGLYEKLVKEQLLIPHQQINENLTGSNDRYATLIPAPVEFISFPWEWSFDMLKDAALLTLRLMKEAIASGMILKDATPYNIQWHNGKFIFIDTLSFEKYNPDEPWIAYRQFCESFLSPLLLMHYSRQSLQQLCVAWPEGIPLTVTRSLLPWRSKWSFHTYLHIHLHANISKRKTNKTGTNTKFSKQKMRNLTGSLEMLIKKLKAPDMATAWSEYYDEASKRNNYLEDKKRIIERWVDELPEIKTAADLGANEGEFSEILALRAIKTIATDSDANCINKLYNRIKSAGKKNIQPVIADLSNPSPAVGFGNTERSSLGTRLHADLCLALALIHHLVIGKNISFEMMARFLSGISKKLIIEFVPKSDEKVKLMLQSKKDIYSVYTKESFEQAFKKHFRTEKQQDIAGSGRTLYLMQRNEE
ncbi:MAG: SAM-dependent methyltransferase [Sphingobacteriales bacterium]|nr:SAM-dependent methyltransferase [Sphingobacteriales bacterium]